MLYTMWSNEEMDRECGEEGWYETYCVSHDALVVYQYVVKR